jgi:hypothetical protein
VRLAPVLDLVYVSFTWSYRGGVMRLAPVLLVALCACGGERAARQASSAGAGGDGPPPDVPVTEDLPTPGMPVPFPQPVPEPIPRTDPAPPPAARIELAPAELRFGFLGVHQHEQKDLVIRSTGTAPARLDGFELAPGSFAAFGLQAPAAVDLAPGEELRVTVTYDPQEPSVVADEGELRFTADGQPQHVPMSGFASAPCLRVDPSVIEFGEVPFGYVPVNHVHVVSCGASGVELRDVRFEGSCGGLTLKGVPPGLPFLLPAGGLTLDLIFDPARCGGPCALVLEFESDLAPVTVPIQASCTP